MKLLLHNRIGSLGTLMTVAIFLLAGTYPQKTLAQCNPSDLVGDWQWTISSMVNMMGKHTYDFSFKADGTYTYKIREGKVAVTQHSGTYKLEELSPALKKSGRSRSQWACKITLSPKPGTVKTNPNAKESILKLEKLSMLTTQPQSFRYRNLGVDSEILLSFQDMEEAGTDEGGQTFAIMPVLK